MSRKRNADPPGRLGRLIKQYRATRGMTQRELAVAAGVGVGSLRDLEQGRTHYPLWGTVECLIAALETDRHEQTELMSAWRAGTEGADPVDDGRPGIAPALRIDVLGPLTVQYNGRPLALGSVRQRALLGLLALHHGTGLHRDAIIDALWDDQPPSSVVAEVQGYIWRLRKLLRSADDGSSGELLATVGAGYRVDATRDQLDLAVFQQLTRDAEGLAARSDVATACDMYGQALDLWRGEALADIGLLRGHPAVTALGCRRAETIMRFAEVAAQSGAHARALPHLRDLCAEEDFNEQAHAHLMIALAACGRQAAALDVFCELRQRLDRELGMPPGPQLAKAHIRVLRQQAGVAVDGQATRHRTGKI
jgi:DNA-binding SARP family transcriptional activator/DNA-binding XRE family transcriptional regulator